MAKLLRGLTSDGSAQILILNSTDMVADAKKIHQTAPTPTAVLGRVLTATSLMGCTLKDKGNNITVNFRGDGKCGHVLAVSDYMGNVKGYVQNPTIDLPTLGGIANIPAAVGKGTLNVVKDTGEKEPYIGITNLEKSDIAGDIANYYAESEQIPTVCALGMKQDRTGKVIAAGKSGKFKTASTMIGLCVWMAFPGVDILGAAVMWMIVLTTVYSGVEYFIQNWNCLWD